MYPRRNKIDQLLCSISCFLPSFVAPSVSSRSAFMERVPSIFTFGACVYLVAAAEFEAYQLMCDK